MERLIEELNHIVESYSKKISNLNDADFSAKPLPHKWSKKEILGHLIDSAQNNLRRFICGQYEATPPNIVYDQDFWVASNEYQNMKKEDIVQLWKLINYRIAAVLKHMPKNHYPKQCDTGTLHSLQWLAEDYVKHMKHHINQIISGSFDVINT
jgi:hypothetical protein